MANKNNVPSPVLPIPPLEYDVLYMKQLVRLLNYFIQQQDNPGNMWGSKLELSDGDNNADIILDAKAFNADVNYVFFAELPTSPNNPDTGLPLPSGAVWRDLTAGNVLKVVP